ncbi:MAG TPA: PepSY domain-containing protein [Caulobacteraceae bacterium]|nr:PepSY domain-containing protein [Caulobacteraceae bacterium]
MLGFSVRAAAVAALVLAGVANARTMAASETDPAFAGHRYAHLVHVSLAQARETALKARPGAITDQELERERGGSGLRYSFDVKSGGRTFEVGVDARTGAVLENDREGANAD